MKYLFIVIFLISSLLSCKSYQELPVVDNLCIEKYQGTWHEIARLPNRFQEGLHRTTATYTAREDGKIDVLNKGYIIGEDNYKTARGVARIPDENVPAKLKVSFFWPFSGNYWVLALDENYKYAMVGEPKRKYLWILARESYLDKKIYNELIELAEELGYNTKDIIKENQY